MSPRAFYLASAFLGLLAAAALSGCENSSVGTLNLQISAAPVVGTQSVVLAITGVQAGGDGSQTDIDFGPEQNVDLDNASAFGVVSAQVPEGYYKWVRLEINPADSYVLAANGARYPLAVPNSFQSTGLFLVGRGLTLDLAVNIDLRTALTVATQGSTPIYSLQPISRLVDLSQVNDIVGLFPESLMIGGMSVTDPACDPQVYVYPGTAAVPQGFFVPVTGGTAPFASSSNVVLHLNQSVYSFFVTQLPPGPYTAVVTCASVDVPGASSLAFSATQTTVVTLAEQGTVTF